MTKISRRSQLVASAVAVLLSLGTWLVVLAAGDSAHAAASVKCGTCHQNSYTRSRHCIVVTSIKSVFSTHLGFEFKIPPNRWAYCARGHVGLTGRAYVQNCGNTGCDHTNRRTFTAATPQSAFIDNGPGRDIDWSQYRPNS